MAEWESCCAESTKSFSLPGGLVGQFPCPHGPIGRLCDGSSPDDETINFHGSDTMQKFGKEMRKD